MKTIKKYILILSMITGFNACKDDFLEVPSKNQIADNFVYDNETNARLALSYLYSSLPDWESTAKRGIALTLSSEANDYTYDKFENFSDNSCGLSWFISWQRTSDRAYTPDSYGVGTTAPLYNHVYPAIPFMYNVTYVGIRACNKFLEGVEKNKANFKEDVYKHMVGEVLFIRAYFYHNLLMAYGGVPIVTKVLNKGSMSDEELFLPRATKEETATFIIGELDKILKDDMVHNMRSTGRVTRPAVLALKGWVELFSHRYAEAAKTYETAISEGIHALYTAPSSEPGDYRFGAYTEQFFEGNNNNIESIFAIQHLAGVATNRRLYWANNYYSQASYSIIQDYRMADGLPREESPLWKPGQLEFRLTTDREPRFYQTISTTGLKYFHTVFPDDLGAVENLRTGFICLKGVDQRVKITDETASRFAANTVLFRHAEVLLHYAEAKIELNQIDQSVYDAIDAVRVRGGIPKLKDSYTGVKTWKLTNQEEMRKIVRRETRIELAFENKRYWDLIRWGTAPNATDYYTAMTELNKPKQGAKEVETTPGSNIYRIETVNIHNCLFYPKNHLFPIFRVWLESNPTMMKQNGAEWVNGQNPGY